MTSLLSQYAKKGIQHSTYLLTFTFRMISVYVYMRDFVTKGLLLFLTVYAASFLLATASNAQNNTSSPACDNTIWVCPGVTDLGADNKGYHTLKLTASGLPTTDPANNTPIQWHTVCGYDDPERGQVFSSNNKEIDRQLCLGEDTYDYMTRPITYRGKQYNNWGMEFLNGSSSPTVSTDGSLEVYVRPHTFNIQNHTCFFVAKTTPNVVGRDENSNVSAGSADSNSLVYATFRTEGEPAACFSVRADPFGRVFNASTLKPLPGAVVNIFDFSSKAAISMPGVPNPVTTREDGMFNFNIEPGTSYLTTSLANAPIETVHQNAALAYTNLYTYNDPIVETLNKPEQRDIPVTGGLKPVLTLMGFSHLQLGSQTRIEGRASWPLTIVEIMQGDKIVAQKSADKFGGFSFFIDNGSLDAGKQITARLKEVDLLTSTTNPVVAQNPATVHKEFDAIPRYLEGYAYSSSGAIMPFAVVRVVVDSSKVVYHETAADTQGFFSIGPRYLPILPYHLEYSPANVTPNPGNTLIVTIPEFIERNKTYISDNLIDSMRGTKNGTPVDPGSYVNNKDQKKMMQDANNGNGNNTNQPGEFSKGSEQRTGILGALENLTGQSGTGLLIILVILFVIVGVVLIVYVKKQHAEHLRRKEDLEYATEENSPEVPEELV